MRSPQVLVYEGEDGRLAALLRELVNGREWTLRSPRSAESCLRLLRQGGPSVLVLKTGRDMKVEMNLLERTTWLFPETPAVVVTDIDHPQLIGLAWDLGARLVMTPHLARDELPNIVVGFMEAAGRR